MESEYQLVRTYQSNTDLLAQLNENMNANDYLKKSVESEKTRVLKTDQTVRKDLYGMRQNYNYAIYMREFYDRSTQVAIFTLYATLILLIPAAMWRMSKLSATWMIAVVGILMILYLLVMVHLVNNIALRRNSAWSHYYWSPGKDVRAEADNDGSC
jgi:hypothetical protein